MKTIKKLLLVLLLPILLMSSISCDNTDIRDPTILKETTTSEEFDVFTEKLFIREVQSNTLTLNYSLSDPESYGIEIDKVTIGHFSPSHIKGELAIYENDLALLNEFKYKELNESQKLTYDVLKHFLELELTQEDFILYHAVLAPTTGVQAQLPILLAEYQIDNKKDIEIYIELVQSVYGYFEEICGFEKLKSEAGLFMNKNSAESIIIQCEDFIKNPDNNFLTTTVNDKITSLNNLTDEEKLTYQEANKDAVVNSLIPAYEMLITTLKDLVETGENDNGLFYYDKGKEFYEYLLAYNTNSSKSVSEMMEMVEASMNDSIMEMTTILEKDPSVYEKLLALSFSLTDPNEIITYLDKAILKDFPKIQDVNCSIEYVPETLQDHISPAMYLVPPIDNYTDNVIYINPQYNMSSIFPTMAHEGYPGHLYQSVYFRDSNPTPIRTLLNFGGYAEGWATYVEYYSYYLTDFDENVSDFIIANMVTNMGIYCMLDMGIHYEGWTLSDTYDYLNNLGVEDKELAIILFDTIVEEPCIYPQYGIGYLEIMGLRDKAEDKLGNKFVLKDFHTFILDIGPAPFPIIEERLEQEIKLVLSNKAA